MSDKDCNHKSFCIPVPGQEVPHRPEERQAGEVPQQPGALFSGNRIGSKYVLIFPFRYFGFFQGFFQSAESQTRAIFEIKPLFVSVVLGPRGQIQ